MMHFKRGLSGRALHYIALFVVLNLAFFLSMALVFSMPDSDVRVNVERSMRLLDGEGGYPRIFSPGDYSVLDSVTDTIMIGKALKGEEGNAFFAAMDVSGYGRYWHGYQVLLRPALRFFQYHEIRMIQGTALLLLLAYLLCLAGRKGDAKPALALMLSLCVTNFFIVPMNMQFSNMHFLMMLASIAALWAADRRWSAHRLGLLFFGMGACAAFFDLLTTPLITLGVPLLLLLWRRAGRPDAALRGELAFVAAKSIAWGCGYGFTFALKWALGTLVTGTNIMADALSQFGLRTSGGGDGIFTVQEALMGNLRGILSLRLEMFLPWIGGCILLLLGAAVLLDRTTLARAPKVLPMLLVGTFPYVWYAAFRNHSGVHSWFTFRGQMITVMAAACSVLYMIHGRACAQKIKGFFQKRS